MRTLLPLVFLAACATGPDDDHGYVQPPPWPADFTASVLYTPTGWHVDLYWGGTLYGSCSNMPLSLTPREAVTECRQQVGEH